jgi:hypothetical protein
VTLLERAVTWSARQPAWSADMLPNATGISNRELVGLQTITAEAPNSKRKQAADELVQMVTPNRLAPQYNPSFGRNANSGNNHIVTAPINRQTLPRVHIVPANRQGECARR